jgi:two-component system chemotaxis response regulator CheY
MSGKLHRAIPAKIFKLGDSYMNILIVEDDFVSRKFMVKFLSKYGNCQTAEDGEMAIRMYQQAQEDKRPYDLICMDIVMPKLDGYETLGQIRAYEKEVGIPAGREVKVIMTSGMDASKQVTKAFELGCVAYATKPIDMVKFNNILRELQLI